MLPSAALWKSNSVNDQLRVNPPDADRCMRFHTGTRRRITRVMLLQIEFMTTACLSIIHRSTDLFSTSSTNINRSAVRMASTQKVNIIMDLTPLFPSGVSLVLADDEMWHRPLRDEEETLITGSVEKRQREFRAGRHAAHTALAQLQAPDIPILRGERREPVWPEGYIGSIAHCRDLCLAVCAIDGEIAGLGIDVEPLTPLPNGVDRYIHTEADNKIMQGGQDHYPERLIFSAKESLYKCYYPLVGRYFGFQSVSLVDIDSGGFDFEPTEKCEIAFPTQMTFHGRYLFDATHLYTACFLIRN